MTQATVAAALLGAQIAVVALVTRAVPRIGRHILVNPATWLIAIAVGLLTATGVSFLITLPSAALAYVLAGRFTRVAVHALGALTVLAAIALVVTGAPGFPSSAGAAAPASVATATPTTLDLLASGLKAGLPA